MKKEKFYVLAIVVIAIVAIVCGPKSVNNILSFKAGNGGLNLKEMNDTTVTSVGVTLQANQTTSQNLEQALISANYLREKGIFFLGAGVVCGASTEYNICCPTLFLKGGVNFNNLRFECQVGDWSRNSIGAIGVDPQYSNFCIDMGEGASVSHAMQLAIVKGGLKVACGHRSEGNFYDLTTGNWYAYVNLPVCKELSVAGGVDLNKVTTGYAAAKFLKNNNTLVLTLNKLGCENQNFILTYNLNNIVVKGKKSLMAGVSVWGKNTEQGIHFVTGLKQGNGTFYAELGSNLSEKNLTPYLGVGTSFTF